MLPLEHHLRPVRHLCVLAPAQLHLANRLRHSFRLLDHLIICGNNVGLRQRLEPGVLQQRPIRWPLLGCLLQTSPHKDSDMIRQEKLEHIKALDEPPSKLRGHTFNRDPALRWLGIWFDSKLNFREHVSKRITQANKVVRHLRNLANTRHGPPPSALRKAVLTCVLSVLTYGSEAWYPGMTRSRTNTKTYQTNEVSTRQHGLVNEIGRVLIGAIRTVLPVWRTTPTSTLYRDAGLPTAQVALDKACMKFSIRLRAVYHDHPFVRRISRRKVRGGKRYGDLRQPRTRLQHAALLLPDFPRPVFIHNEAAQAPNSLPACGPKAVEAKAFRQWQSQLSDAHIVVFSDGSKLSTDAVGWGYAIYQGRRKIGQGKGRLGVAEVFDGEVEGALNGLRRALRTRPGHRIHVCLDNTAVIRGLLGEAAESSQAAFLKFQDCSATASVEVRWVPGHQGIEGNEEADRLAKEGAALPPNSNKPPTLAGVRRLARTKVNEQFSHWWEHEMTKR
ncbi:hypothetical protein PCL_10481 [Purpureocillium lilacinum]|uniref:RNase H type-1 domain-containing protein n=1 Tax=Purpureocillium lilacinum TaxID=33203 RepID=A0A2U3DQ77_PURLI|nr:hypothetical protein PCL_10481 [Purpureocillium lilacinum]